MNRKLRLVLFDIDGTLINCGPQVRRIFSWALREVFGTAGGIDEYDFTGRTDHQITLELMTGAGILAETVEEALPRVRRTYASRLQMELDPAGMRLLPGALELLEYLAGRDDVTVGLLTGNWEAGARIKLAPFDLNRFFAFGAFGDGHASRGRLPPVALEEAGRVTGLSFLPQDTLIVGDSPLDVACAREHGIPALAVATGRTPHEDLEAAGADWVVGDLGGAESHPAFAPTGG